MGQDSGHDLAARAATRGGGSPHAGVFTEAFHNRPAVLKAVIHPSLYEFDNTELGL